MKQVDGELVEMRIVTRMQREDIERAKMLKDEMEANLKSYKLENEMLREKLTVLKQEYYRMVRI